MEQGLEQLAQACAACQRCALGATRTHSVFGTGNPCADLMFVGEAPGEQEDLSGIPFVGRAGQLLDKFLYAVDIPRAEVYIANILKCRPPSNRDPLPEEEDACIGHLREQVRLIRPRIIVCLGRIAAMKIISPTFKISADHGKWFDRAGVRMMALYHPAALLRDPRRKEETLPDLYAIEEELKKLQG